MDADQANKMRIKNIILHILVDVDSLVNDLDGPLNDGSLTENDQWVVQDFVRLLQRIS